MRLIQALTGVLCVPACILRSHPTRTQDFLSAIRPITIFPSRSQPHWPQASSHAFHSRSLSSRTTRFFSGSPAPVSAHNSLSLFPTFEAYRNFAKKQPLVSTRVATCFSMSDSGQTGTRVRVGEEVIVMESEPESVYSGPDSARDSETEACQGSHKNAREGGRQAETVTCSSVGASEGQFQVTACSEQVEEKEMEAESVVPQKVTNGGDEDTSQQTSNKQSQPAEVSEMSKRAQKKLLRKQKFKEQRKAKRAGNYTNNSNPGFDSDLFTQTDYYFENGLRKVYPYHFTFSTYAKERWYGRTVQDIFEREFRVDSPDNFRTSVAKGFMRVNGKVAKLDHVIRNGDLIEHHIHRHENPVSGQPLEVVADTEEVVVINKPPSIPCHPCGKFRFNSIVFIMGKELGYANLRNIYRLDRLTSGVLIMGKTAKKTKELENHILHRHVQKEYLARVVGEFPEEERTVDQPLDCLSYKLTLWRVVQKGGKPSSTTFKRLSYNGQTSLVKCMPHTGRTHQIRVHLQYLGHPIVNDPYYNSPAWGPQRGKGGHCDVSLEELCQRIMKEHNVGLWLDGENPLFHERLAAQTPVSQQSSSLHCNDNDDDNTAAPPASETVGDDIDVDVPAAVTEPNKSNDGRPASEESRPPAKKARLDIPASCPPGSEGGFAADSVAPSGSLDAGSASPQALTAADGPDSQTSPHRASADGPESQTSPHRAAAAPVTPAPGTNVIAVPSESDVSRDPETGVALSQACEAASADYSVLATSDAAAVQGEGGCLPSAGRGAVVERKGFDPQCWVPDAQCESCRLKYIDPKPSELHLYLHALRYKGPGWDYSTKSPEWAADDWQEPEDYAKYLQ